MKVEKNNGEKIGFRTSWLGVVLFWLIIIIMMAFCFIRASSTRFAIPRDIQNAVSMNPTLTKMVYNEHTEKLIITGKNRKSEFKLRESDWGRLKSALTKREKKDWTGWRFGIRRIPSEEGIEYIIHEGTRELKQEP